MIDLVTWVILVLAATFISWLLVSAWLLRLRVRRAALRRPEIRAATEAELDQLLIYTAEDRAEVAAGAVWTRRLPAWERDIIQRNHRLVRAETARRQELPAGRVQ